MLNIVKKFLLLISIVSLVACGGAEERKAGYLQKGKALLDANNYEKALLEFKNVLQIDPKSVDGYYYMAKVNESQGEYKKAFGGYLKALEIKADYIDALVGAGRIYLRARSADKAIENANKVLASNPQYTDALVLRASGMFQKNEVASALKDVRSALDIDPDHVSSLALLARIYVQKDQADKAKSLIKNALQKQPDNDSLIALLIQLYKGNKDYSLAVIEMQKLISRHPDKFSFRLQKARLYSSMKDNESAEIELRKAIADLPENMDAKKALIEYLANYRDLMFAQVELSRFQKEDVNNPELKLISAKLYTTSKDYHKAEEIYRDIINKYDEAALSEAQYQLARLLVGTKHIDKARPVLEALLEKNPKHIDGLSLRGSIAISDRNAEIAIADFRTILNEMPASEESIKYLAQAYLLANQPELAEEQLKKFLSLKPLDVSVRLGLARLLQQQKLFSDSIEQLQLVLKIEADNYSAKDLLFKSYLNEKNYVQALEIAESLKKAKPEEITGEYYHGLVLQLQKKNTDAIKRFVAALKKQPKAIAPLNMMVRAALASNKPEVAIKELNKLIKIVPDYFVAYNLKGEVYASQKKYKKAIIAFKKALELKSDWWIAYRNLAGTYMLNKQNNKAISAYKDGINNAKKNDQLMANLAMLYESESMVDKAIALYDEMAKEKPESSTVANKLAMLLVEYHDDKPSKDKALSLVTKFEGQKDAGLLDTRGWVYFKNGHFDKALSALKEADQLAPNRLIIYYHLGSVYYSQGDKSQARKYLQTVIDSDAKFRWREKVQQMIDEINQRV